MWTAQQLYYLKHHPFAYMLPARKQRKQAVIPKIYDLRHTRELSYQMPFDDIELPSLIDHALETLTPREERAVRSHFGIGADALSYREIGDQYLHCSASRAREILEKALRKLRHPARSKRLREHYRL